MHHMNWDDLRFFLAVASKGSVRAGSQLLGVNHSTVSRRINAFENKIGVRLFERLSSGYVLTPAGEDMLASAQRIESEFDSLDRRVFGQDTQLSGVLRVTAPVHMIRLLMPDLVAFTKVNTGIELEIVSSYAEFNLTKREADVAIRVTNTPPEHLVGRKVASYATTIYASDEYLASHDINDPSSLNWIGWDEGTHHPKWVKASEFPCVPARHQVNDAVTQIEATKAGLGIGMLPCFMADVEPTLQRLSSKQPAPRHDIWILTHKDLRDIARVRLFNDFMVEAIRNRRDLIEGRCPINGAT